MANMFDVIQNNIDNAEVSRLPVSCEIEDYTGITYVKISFSHSFAIHDEGGEEIEKFSKLYNMLYKAQADGKILLTLTYVKKDPAY